MQQYAIALPVVADAFNNEREAQRMLDAALTLQARRLPDLAPARDARDDARQDLDPASGTYQHWIVYRTFTVTLRRPDVVS